MNTDAIAIINDADQKVPVPVRWLVKSVKANNEK